MASIINTATTIVRPLISGLTDGLEFNNDVHATIHRRMAGTADKALTDAFSNGIRPCIWDLLAADFVVDIVRIIEEYKLIVNADVDVESGNLKNGIETPKKVIEALFRTFQILARIPDVIQPFEISYPLLKLYLRLEREHFVRFTNRKSAERFRNRLYERIVEKLTDIMRSFYPPEDSDKDIAYFFDNFDGQFGCTLVQMDPDIYECSEEEKIDEFTRLIIFRGRCTKNMRKDTMDRLVERGIRWSDIDLFATVLMTDCLDEPMMRTHALRAGLCATELARTNLVETLADWGVVKIDEKAVLDAISSSMGEGSKDGILSGLDASPVVGNALGAVESSLEKGQVPSKVVNSVGGSVSDLLKTWVEGDNNNPGNRLFSTLISMTLRQAWRDGLGLVGIGRKKRKLAAAKKSEKKKKPVEKVAKKKNPARVVPKKDPSNKPSEDGWVDIL